MAFDKVRIRFCKSGDLRLVSHLDLMRAVERLLRRADLPVRQTEGFHPAPRLIFAQSLSLGLIGQDEVLEIEFTEDVPPEDVLARVRKQAPPGLIFHSATRIPIKSAARPRRAVYRWPIVGWVGTGGSATTPPSPPLAGGEEDGQSETLEPLNGAASLFPTQTGAAPILPPCQGGRTRETPLTQADLADRIANLLSQSELWADREKPRPRQVNVRPYLRAAWADADAVWFDIWLTQEGTARVDELARMLGLGDLYLTGPAVERATLEIADETDAAEAARTPTITQQVRPWNGGPPKPAAVEVPREVWGATENGPIVE